MANRILRDWTDSDKMSTLSVHAERFFTRLIMKVDDYGCFYADTRLLKANLFPLLLDTIREADITRWIAECKMAGLIVLYEVNKKCYVQINDFRQRLDKAKHKYPIPTDNDSVEVVTEFPPETETNPKLEKETDIDARKLKFAETIKPFIEKYGKEMCNAFYKYWTEPNKSGTKFRQESEKNWELSLRLDRWARNDKNFSNSKPGSSSIPNAIM